MANLKYNFLTSDDGRKSIAFKDDQGAELFFILCDNDVDFTKLVEYLITAMDSEQETVCDYQNNPDYTLGQKENLIKTAIGNIIIKYNEIVHRTEIEPNVDDATAVSDDIPF